ncbi:MAG: hypothetical protein HY707_08410 [Ignavibacteriae bacterium]|nr:hypothetical protein [Ignavibacteriota bacterium]
MKKVRLLLMVALVLSVLSVTAQDKKKKDMTLMGEVIDVKCYLNGMMESMGADHKQCAIDCIKGGLPVGILDAESKNVYTVVPKTGMKGANEELVKYVTQKVKLTGTFMEKGGQKIFFYTKVEEVK